MEAGLPENDSELAREGQLLHDYSHHPEYNRSMLKANQWDLLKRADELTEQAIDTCQKEIRVATFKDYRETTLSMLGTKIPLTGTPDLARYYLPGEAAIIVDLKFGYNVVDRADVNLQLRAYAVLSYDFSPSKKIFAAIVQPRASIEERLTIAEYLPEDIEASRQQIIQILEASEHDRAKLNPSEEACRYCRAKMICPAFKEAMTVAVITPEKALSVAAREAYLTQRLAELTDEQLEKVYVAERLANMIHDPLGDEIRKRKAAGGMENFEIAKDSEVREVSNVRRALSLLTLAGLDKAEIFECVTKFSLTRLTEQLRKKNPTWPAKQAREWVDKKLASVIELQTRKGRIVHQ